MDLENAKYDDYKNRINAISCLDGANSQEQQIFTIRKNQALNLVASKAAVDQIESKINELNTTNTDIQNRKNNEAAAAARAAANASRSSYSSTSSSSSYSSNTTSSSGGYYCVDGMYVGNANPHARGRANACYGHGGFAVNH